MATNAVITDSAPVELEIPTGGDARAEWLRSGKLPEATPEVSTQADSSTAPIDAEAESSAADPETVESVEVEEQPVTKPKKRGAEARIIELLEENKRLKEAQSGTKETKAESSPAPKSAEPSKKPSMNDFETMAEYEEALDKHYRETARREAQAAVQEAEFKRELNAKLKEARTRYENFDDVAKPLIGQLTDGSIDRSVLETIDDSPLFTDVLYVIGGTEESAADFLAKAKSNPRLAIKMIGAIEQLISDESKAEKTEQPRDDKGKFATDKKISKAPPPPTELSGTSGAPPDEVGSAVEREDVRGYFNAANRRDLARRKG